LGHVEFKLHTEFPFRIVWDSIKNIIQGLSGEIEDTNITIVVDVKVIN
jgi:hypothetical protein